MRLLLAVLLSPVLSAATATGTLQLASADDHLLTLEYSTRDANASNWIGIYHAGGGGPDDQRKDQEALRWAYAPDARGSVGIAPPVGARGRFKAFLLAADGYEWLAEPITISVGGDDNDNGQEEEEDGSVVRIMTWNLWYGGTKVNGYHDKQVRFITDQKLDVVGLQEASGGHARRLGQALGWNYHQANGDDSYAIISRHRIAKRHESVSRSSGVQININTSTSTSTNTSVHDNSTRAINFWSAHLAAYPYGPYEFCFGNRTADQVTETESASGRTGQTTSIVRATEAQRSSSTPFILAGDFNAPSHLDWTAENAHCGGGVGHYDWPSSRLLVDGAGLVDSFRAANPDPATAGGNSWSPVEKHNADRNADEPQDRIDFIYSNRRVKVVGSEVKVAGTPKPFPDYADNEWTSDHAAVISTFQLV